MTVIVGRQATTLDEVLDKITTAMPRATEEEKDFCELVRRWYQTLAQVRQESDGHGVTLVVWNSERSGFEDYLKEARPYNGAPHKQDDHDITHVMGERRHRDAAIVSDKYGMIIGANVPLPLDTVSMRQEYRLSCQIADFMGCAADEDLGTRAASALWATKLFPQIAIITLGENHEDGTKGPMRLYFNGDMVHSTDGRYLHWEYAVPSAGQERQDNHASVIPLRSYHQGPPVTHCGDGSYREPQRAMGGPI